MERILKNLRFITFKDIIDVFILIIAIVPAIFVKIIKKKKIWLICEDKNEARDNGFVFFQYMCREHKDDIKSIYAINKKSVDYCKVKDLGECIQFGSIKHWIYYLSADVNISSQKSGKPNAAIFYFLEVYGILKNNRVFLQHGITLSDAEWLYYKNTKFRLFICGAKPEYDYIIEKFGYPSNYVKYLGFPRFDNLYDISVKDDQVLVMPSWREWLTRKTDAYYALGYNGIFTESKYYKYWNDFLNNKRLNEVLKENNLKLIFYPHRNMQPYISDFKTNSERIIIANWQEYDIQKLLKESAIMITDYSSVCMDFAYMNKPIIYYQFDEEDFRKGQYAKGYFDYKKDGFGSVEEYAKNVIKQLEVAAKRKFKVEDKFVSNVKEFFKIRDNKNCERIYKAINEI